MPTHARNSHIFSNLSADSAALGFLRVGNDIKGPSSLSTYRLDSDCEGTGKELCHVVVGHVAGPVYGVLKAVMINTYSSARSYAAVLN